MKHSILRDLGILDEIEWLPTGALHHVRGGPVGETFALPAGFDAAYDALAERFPDKRSAIQEFLADVERIHNSLWTIRQARDTGSVAKFTHALWELAPAAAAWNDTLDEVFTQRFGGAEALKCALGRQSAVFRRRSQAHLVDLLRAGAGRQYRLGRRLYQRRLAPAQPQARQGHHQGRRRRAARPRSATAILTDADGEAAGVRHVARKTGDDEQEISARVVLANCAPSVAGELLPAKARALMEEEFGARPLSTSLFCANFGLAQKPATVGLKDFNAIVLPETMTRFSQYGDGAGALGADPAGALPLYSIANFTAVDSGLWDEPPVLVSVLGLDNLSNWDGLSREEALARRERWLDALQGAMERDYPGFSGLVSERVMLNAFSMAGYLNTPRGAVYGFEPLPPEDPILAGFPRTPRTPVAGLYLASAFGGEHGFNGAILSGAEAARLAAASLETGAE